jgi:glycosyltransferase involved in cell wall biosynthesis
MAAARAIVARASAYDLVLLNGAVSFAERYDEILLAGAIARAAPQVPVVLEGCYWEEGTRAVERLLAGGRTRAVAHDPPARRGRALAHALVAWVRRPSVHYIVFGSDERRVFAERWSVPEHRVAAMTYHGHDWPQRAGPQADDDGFVFAGGNSLRDYRPLLAAAERVDAEIVIATTLAMGPAPPNVRAGPRPEDEYRRLARRAALHVVPMIADPPRSAGQASYIDALMLSIPVIVTDGLGVRDHLRDGEDALIVAPGDPAGLAQAIHTCLADGDLRRRLGEAGRARAQREFTLEAFRAREYALLQSIWDARRAGVLTARGRSA